MAKSKKKQSPHEANKLAAAQHKNEFFRNLIRLAKHCGNEKIISMIPAKERDEIYALHMHKIKVKFDDRVKELEKSNKKMLGLISRMLNYMTVPITKDGFTVTVSEYFSYPLTIALYICELKEDKYPQAKELIDVFKPYMDYEEGYQTIMLYVNVIMFGAATLFNDFTHFVYSFRFDTINYLHNKLSPAGCIIIDAVAPPKIDVTINNIKRPAFQIIWGKENKGFSRYFFSPDDFNIKGSFSKLQLNAYIQNHALIRLKERLDNLPVSLQHFGVINSISKHIVTKDIHGNFLLEYSIFNVKLGYLRIDLVEGMVVIRTFLFITNNSVPEGEKLNKLTGAEKLDKEFLMIDKLSTFTSDKIQENEIIKELFTKAGCSSLFKIKEFFKDYLNSTDVSPEMMIKHLKLDKISELKKDIDLNSLDENIIEDIKKEEELN